MHSQQSSVRGVRIFLALFIGYAVYSGSRKSLTVSKPALLRLGPDATHHGDADSSGAGVLSLSEMGLVESSFSMAYGWSKMFSGVFSDFLPCNVLFAAGLALAGGANLLFAMVRTTSAGAGTAVSAFSACWLANGLVQGVGWPSLAKILRSSFPPSIVGTLWALMTTAGHVGYLVAPFVFMRVLHQGEADPTVQDPWRSVFKVSGALALACALLAYVLLPAPEAAASSADEKDKPQGQTRTFWQALGDKLAGLLRAVRTDLVSNTAVWLIIAADALVYFVMKGVADNTQLFLTTNAGLSLAAVTNIFLWHDIGGIAGSFLSGMISDLLGGNRALTSMAACFLAIIPVAALGFVQVFTSSPTVLSVMLCLASALINGPKTLCGIAVRDAAGSKLEGTAAGILGLAGQFGASFAGAPLGWLVQSFGWEALYPTLALASLVAGGLLIPATLRLSRVKPKHE